MEQVVKLRARRAVPGDRNEPREQEGQEPAADGAVDAFLRSLGVAPSLGKEAAANKQGTVASPARRSSSAARAKASRYRSSSSSEGSREPLNQSLALEVLEVCNRCDNKQCKAKAAAPSKP